MKIKEPLYKLLEPAGKGDRTSRFVDLLLIALILGDFGAFVLETIPEFSRWHFLFNGFAHIAVTVFVVEYVLRVWTATVGEDFARPIKGRLAYMVSPMALVDLVAILPALFLGYHAVLGGVAEEVPGQLTLLRIVRLVRLFKIARYSPAIVTVQRALHRVRRELNVLLAGILVVLVVSSTLLHAVEAEAQPESFGSLPQAFWYALVVMTTVGFGDVVAVTGWGKLITSVLALLGIALFALPSGLLGAAFTKELRRGRTGSMRTSGIQCPHCQGHLRYDPMTGTALPGDEHDHEHDHDSHDHDSHDHDSHDHDSHDHDPPTSSSRSAPHD